MANDCYYSMQVQGRPENVEEFLQMIQVNYAYDDEGNCYNPSDNNKPVERHLWRVFDAYLDDDEIVDGIRSIIVNGNCAWSIYSCMCEGEYTYQTQNPGRKGTTLQKESERLQLTIEVFSEECGMCFMEHYLFVNGECKINNCVDWNEYCTSDYDTVEEMNEDCGTNFTQEEFEAEDFISVGGLEWEFGNWE